MRTGYAWVAALVAFGFAPSAFAQVSCTNDIDCPAAACGGMVCQWGASGHYCVPAGTDPQGQDGWCTTTADCKCASLGATCSGVHCTFTAQPQISGPDLGAAPDLGSMSDLGPVLDLATAHDGAPSSPDLTASVPYAPPASGYASSGCSAAGATSSDSIPADAFIILALAPLAAFARRRVRRARRIHVG